MRPRNSTEPVPVIDSLSLLDDLNVAVTKPEDDLLPIHPRPSGHRGPAVTPSSSSSQRFFSVPNA